MTGHPPTLDRHIFNTEGRCTNGCGADAGRALEENARLRELLEDFIKTGSRRVPAAPPWNNEARCEKCGRMILRSRMAFHRDVCRGTRRLSPRGS